MARFDKYDPISGGFRAQLAEAITATSGAGSSTQIAIPLGVGINSSGLAVRGSGATGVIAVIVADQAKAIGDWIDCMTDGEVVDLDEAAFDPGATYFSSTAGVLSTTNTGIRVGFTVADKSITDGTIRSRLIVRSGRFGTGA
jgi:small-conductance mechanosensitive channel